MKATVTRTTAQLSSRCSMRRWPDRGLERRQPQRSLRSRRHVRIDRAWPGVALVLAAATATAQDSAVKSAADAFGERVGTEQSGLYSETQVRGFDLNDSGAYRIDDAYFSRAAAMNDPVLAGVGVRVGDRKSTRLNSSHLVISYAVFC